MVWEMVQIPAEGSLHLLLFVLLWVFHGFPSLSVT